MRTLLYGRYVGPLREGDNGGASGGGAGGDPPSLPAQPAPAQPAPAPAAAAPAPAPAKPPRKRAASKKSGAGTTVTAGNTGGASVAHTDAHGNRISGTVKGPGDVLEGISELPAPGGLVLMLAILILFLFAIVPVTPKGKTRLALLWDTLRGKTSLPAPPAAPASSSSSSQSQQQQQNWLQDAEASALMLGVDLVPLGGNAGGAGMVPGDAIAANGYHRVQDAPLPESVAAAPTNGYGYVDAYDGPVAPQPYYGENVYDAPVFPELE